MLYVQLRARAALGYADERQIKMHNPGKSFRIFHNGREISLLVARVQSTPRPTITAHHPSSKPSRANSSVTVASVHEWGKERRREKHLLRVERG